jgi:hypothetical protein
MRYVARVGVFVCAIASLLMIVRWKPVVAAGEQVVLIVGGDVEWALNSRPPTVRYRVGTYTPNDGTNTTGCLEVRHLEGALGTVTGTPPGTHPSRRISPCKSCTKDATQK